jgi:hypothetical protein
MWKTSTLQESGTMHLMMPPDFTVTNCGMVREFRIVVVNQVDLGCWPVAMVVVVVVAVVAAVAVVMMVVVVVVAMMVVVAMWRWW